MNYSQNSNASNVGDPTPDGLNGDYDSFHFIHSSLPPLQENVNHTSNRLVRPSPNDADTKAQTGLVDQPLVQPPVSTREQGSRRDKDGPEQSLKGTGLSTKRQQARKLQTSDFDWYAISPPNDPTMEQSRPYRKDSFHDHSGGRRPRKGR